MERTFVMIKPDGVQRGLVAGIIGKIENKGYKLVGLKMLQVQQEIAQEHYAEHVGKPFYEGLVRYITSSPVVAMVWEGESAVQGIRGIIGSTDPQQALPGTIRGLYGLSLDKNLVHGSDSEESAAREIQLYFEQNELLDYRRAVDEWL